MRMLDERKLELPYLGNSSFGEEVYNQLMDKIGLAIEDLPRLSEIRQPVKT